MVSLLGALLLSAAAPHARSQDLDGATNSPGVLQYLGERASRLAAKLPAVPADRRRWEWRREQVRHDLAKALGLPNRPPMRAAVERTSEKDGLLTEEVCYLWDERAYVAGQVVRPKDGLGPLPAIVIPPGWTGELTQDFYKTFVYHMARKGYLILFITDPHVGKRKTGNLELYALGSVAGTQAMGVQVFDTLRGLDYLLTRRDVDPGRIGIAGLCQGAEQTWLAAALEERFKVAAPVCGTTTYESWAQMPHFLRVDLSDASPYVAGILQHADWHEIGACISPRPVLLASNSGDNWWPRAGFDKVVLTLKQIYALEGAPDRFEVVCDLRSHSMTPFIPELDPWFEQHLKAAPASPASPLPCEKPEDPDFDMSHYFQRRIARQTSSLPKQFDSLQTWRSYRDGIGQWLASACAVDELRRGQPKANGSRSQQGIRTESVELPQDDNFYCPATVFSREPAQTPRAAVVLSHASAACMKDPSVEHTARALAEAGFVVIVPEHASANPASKRFLLLKHGFLISLYGAADTVGLPPLAMRVWDDLSCVEYLSRRDKGARILLAGTDIGGLDAVLAAALDRRVAGVVSVGAITVQDWAEKVAPNLKAFNTIVPCLPSLTEKTDWQFFYAALAPRPLLLVPSNDRKNWPNSAFRQVSDTCRSLYDLAGAGQGFTVAQREDCTEALANRTRSPAQKLLATVAKELVAQASEETHQRTAETACAVEPTRQPVFTPQEVAAYQPKGPLQCFRQICLNYNNPTRAKKLFTPEEHRAFFSEADPVAYARFCKEINLDAALMLAVPQGGYTTYLQTRVGEPYPGMKGDFLGQTIRELHRQDIAALGYIIIGWNLKYAREHPEVSFGWYPLICLNSAYTDLLCAYSREVLTWYPVDGLRYDILDQPVECRCPACKQFYRELFGEEMPAQWKGWQTRERFRLASINRCVERLYKTCKQTKPTVAVWQNWFSDAHAADLRASTFVDVAYLEFADPFRELFLNGVFNKGGIITGKILEQPSIRRLCLVLGGRCYSYFEVNGKAALPDQTDWFRNDLAPFYAMVSRIEPYLTNAAPVPYVGVIFSEATRFRFHNFDRAPYLSLLRRLTEPYLKESLPLSYISVEHLAQRNLAQYKLLILPEPSGLTEEHLDVLRGYVRSGGQLLLTGETLYFDAEGRPRRDFALADEMGVQHLRTIAGLPPSKPASRWAWRNHLIDQTRAVLRIDRPGRQTFHVWMREGGARLDRFLLTQDPDYRPEGEGPPAINLKDTKPAGNRIVFESDNYEENIARGQSRWLVRGDLPGFVGENYMQATPRDKEFKTDYETQAPEMRYSIEFPRAGAWYVWVREACDSTREDSIHVGLQSKGLLTFDFNTSFEGKGLGPGTTAAKQHDEGTALIPVDLAGQRELAWSAIAGPVTPVAAQAGKTVLNTRCQNGQVLPLLHLQACGKGRIAYLATSQDLVLMRSTINALVGGMPLTVTPKDKQAILIWQDQSAADSSPGRNGRWILHLMQDGDYVVDLRADYAAPKRIAGQYPATGWSASLEPTNNGVRIKAGGNAKDRLLVLQ